MNERKEALERARQSWEQKNFQAAYELYEQLLRDAPNDAEILREYARAKYVEFDDLEQAAQLFERAVAADPNGSVAALLRLGELYSWGYGKGYQAAFDVYQRVLELDPHNVNAYTGIGMLQGTPTLSFTLQDRIEAFRTVTQIAPQCGMGHRNLGMALAKNGDWEEARNEFEIAEKLLEQSGEHGLVQSTKEYRKQLEKKHIINGSAYYGVTGLIWDF